MRLFFLLVTFSLSLAADEKWPARYQSTQPVLQRLADRDGSAVWATRHFVIVCEIELPRPRLENLARTIESVPLLFKQLPLPLWAPPQTEKAVLRLCKSETSFVARGAPVDAAGCYLPRVGEVLIRGDLYLNPPQARATQLRLSPNNDLLVHELTHLAMHQYGGRLPAWLLEGLAEYFASCHTGKGNYDFSQSTRLIKQHIEKFYPIERFPSLALPSATSLAGASQRDWLKVNRTAAPEDRYRPYAAALLLTHYHLEGGSERRIELSDHLTDALQTRNFRDLLEDPPSVEKKLVIFWKSKGLALVFQGG